MKIVIWGGSALSSPALFKYLADVDNLPELEVILIGRSEQRLTAVTRASQLMVPPTSIRIQYLRESSPNLDSVLSGADLIVIQIRVGGFSGRAFDETFPLEYGTVGDEGLGAGGLSSAWRSWPEIKNILDQVLRCNHSARVIFLSSPISILVRAAIRCFGNLNLAGICELPWTTLTDILRELDRPPLNISFDYCGINHLGWFYRISQNSVDLLDAFSRRRAGRTDFPQPSLIREYSGIPLKYARLHFFPAEIVREQMQQPVSRGQTLRELRDQVISIYQNGVPAEIKSALQQRPSPWYSQAVGPLVASLAGKDMSIPFFLSVRNDGIIPWLPNDDVVELAHVWAGHEFVPIIPKSPVPHKIAAMLNAFTVYERLAADAVISRDPDLLLKALKIHPWMTGFGNLHQMAQEISEYQIPDSRGNQATDSEIQ